MDALTRKIQEAIGAELEPGAIEHTIRNQVHMLVGRMVYAEADKMIHGLIDWPDLRRRIAAAYAQAAGEGEPIGIGV